MTNVTEAEFNKSLGIEIRFFDGEDRIYLPRSKKIENFYDAIHPAALGAAAEAGAGHFLLDSVQLNLAKVIPNLRKFEVQIKKPARHDVYVKASAAEEELISFRSEIDKRGRGSISIKTEVRDINGLLCMTATFDWLIQATPS